MDRRQVCVANVSYKKPSRTKQMRNLLKYLTYRESRDEKAHFEPGVDRWMDHGMGRTVTEIAERCAALQGEHVLLFSLVINPNPDLMAMVPEAQREAFVRTLTERTVEDYVDARGMDGGVEWSAVLHHRRTTDSQAPNQHNPHTHVVLPGTYYDVDEGIRRPLYFWQRKGANDIAVLHRICEGHTVNLLDRHVGPDWEQRYDALHAVRVEQERVVEQSPDADWEDIGPVWGGVRRVDEQTTALGMYAATPDDDTLPDRRQLRFHALLVGLPHEQAEALRPFISEHLSKGYEALEALLKPIAQMSHEQRAQFIAEHVRPLRPREIEMPGADRSPDIDFF